jgi:hypothetical protein
MYSLRDHVIGHTLFHSFADLVAVHSRRAVKGNDACSAAVGERPCYGRYQVCSHNLAQMRLEFLEFDPVAKNLDLIVNATQVVERPGGVLVQLPERPDPWSKIRTDPAPRPGTVRRFRFRS